MGPLAPSHFRVSDGAELLLGSCGENVVGRPFLVINALGMPLACWGPMAAELQGRGRRLVVYGARGLPSPVDEDQDLSPSRHVQDARELIEGLALGPVHLIGWCTGARLALRLAALHPELVASATLVGGAFNLDEGGLDGEGPDGEALNTKYQQVFTTAMRRVAQKRRYADAYYQMVHVWGGRHELLQQQVDTVLSAVEPGVEHLASAPYQSAQTIYTYARLIDAFDRDREQGWLTELRAPTLFLCGDRDHTTAPLASRTMAALVRNGRAETLEDSGHFVVYTRPEQVVARMLPFVQGLEESETC